MLLLTDATHDKVGAVRAYCANGTRLVLATLNSGRMKVAHMATTALAWTPKLNLSMPLTGLRRHATHATHVLQLKCEDARNACQHAAGAAAASCQSACVQLLQHMSDLQRNAPKLQTPNISRWLLSVHVALPSAPKVQLAPLAQSLWRNAKSNTRSLASRAQRASAAAQHALESSWTAIVVLSIAVHKSASYALSIAMANSAHHLQTTMPHVADDVLQATAHHLQTTVPHVADTVLQTALEVSDIALASAVNYATDFANGCAEFVRVAPEKLAPRYFFFVAPRYFFFRVPAKLAPRPRYFVHKR
jgi:hypothetical protein